MKRFKLKANSIRIPYSVNPCYRRKYSHISFYCFFREHLSESLRIVEVNSPHIKTAEFNYETLDSERFMKALNSMYNLERFKFKNCNLLWEDDSNAILPLPTLKTLYFAGKCKSLKYFRRAKLTSLTLEDLSAHEVDLFNKFIESQKWLERLEVTMTSQQRLRLIQNVPFFIEGSYPCLKKLSIKAKLDFCISPDTLDQALSFFKSIATTLEELNFHCRAPNSVYSTILKQMPALKKIALTVASMPSEKSFYDTLKVSKRIKDLCLISSHFDTNIERILKCFTHIECLRVETRPCVLELPPGLTNPALTVIRPDLKVRLRHLKSVHYEHCDGLWYLGELPKFYPDLETLSLSELYFPHITWDIIVELGMFKALKHVRIRGGRKSMSRFYNLVNEAKLDRVESIEIVVFNYHDTFEKVFRLKMIQAEKVLEPCDYLSSTVF